MDQHMSRTHLVRQHTRSWLQGTKRCIGISFDFWSDSDDSDNGKNNLIVTVSQSFTWILNTTLPLRNLALGFAIDINSNT